MRLPQRGRAIVRRLPSRADNKTYRPGDFLLTRSEGGLARVVELATGGDLNHAALIVDASGGLIEANTVVMTGASPLRRAHIQDYQEAGAPCWVGYVELQEGTRPFVVDFAERLHETQSTMSEVGMLALALHALLCIAPRARTARHVWLRPLHAFFDRHALVLREEHTYLSGEFVARALERGGFIWDVDPAHVTPADLFARFHLVDESERGVLVPLTQMRQVRQAESATVSARGPAQVSALVPRARRSAAASEAALRVEVPEPFEAAMPDGVRTLVQLALLAIGSLTVAHGIEKLLRAVRQES
jgi:hypothetical protein